MSIPGYDVSKVSTLDRGQRRLHNQLTKGVSDSAGQGLDYLSRLSRGEGEAFDQLEAPAFSALQRAEGQIASRFSQAGARNSSAFRNAIAGAAGDVSQNLQQQRQQIQMDAITKLLGLSQNLLGNRTFENVITPEEQGPDIAGLFGDLFGKIAPAAISAFSGNPVPAGMAAFDMLTGGNKGGGGGGGGGYKGSFGTLPDFTGR